MDDEDIIIESYGITPPENSKPLWGRDNPNEDDIVTSLDFQTSLRKLKPLEREVIQLFNEGYSTREIASLINIPTMTVQHAKERAIGKLRDMLSVWDSSIFI